MTARVSGSAPLRRGQLVSNHPGSGFHINIRKTPEIPTGGSNVVAQRIPGTEVLIQAERGADAQGHRWFLVYEKDPGDLGWVRGDVLREMNPSPVPAPAPAPVPTPAPAPPAETELFFETDGYAVRLQRAEARLTMNVYNKFQNRTEAAGIPAVRLPQLDTDSGWQGYLAHQNGQTYIARFIPRANTELLISDDDSGAIAIRQTGFRAEGREFIR
ncbi:MAG: hypothetical protein AAF766_23765 [Cyanobacteria bacterium P01_D01_bin.14]